MIYFYSGDAAGAEIARALDALLYCGVRASVAKSFKETRAASSRPRPERRRTAQRHLAPSKYFGAYQRHSRGANRARLRLG
jgi:hypothetical protein